METGLPFWIGFNAGVLVLLALDLFVFQRKNRTPKGWESAAASVGWITLSLGFGLWVWHGLGPQKALQFFTGYLIEYSLSVDNLFVFVLIFSYFKVKAHQQHRVLFWGIIGALIMRGAMIAIGVRIVARFEWMLYCFGLFLLITGIRMFFKKEKKPDLDNFAVRFFRKWLRVTPDFHGNRFFVKLNGSWALTPLALALVVIEVMDLVFAVDSIPAVFAVTTDSFIVYTSNVCAILGLRSLYFALAHLAGRFVYLQYGLAAVLSFIGFKMLMAGWFVIPVGISLGIVVLCLSVSMIAGGTHKNEEAVK